MAHRTTDPKPDADTRCPAVEGAQRCVSARHGKHQNHRWGPRGETSQWNADGTHKGWWDVPESPTDVLAMQTPARPDTLPAVPPDGVQAADPAQPTPGSGKAPEPSGETAPSPAGSGGGPGRSTSLERPGQVAAGFGTSSGDLPFQAAHLGVLIPADRPQDARALAEEAAHVGGLMRTLGQITADYHAQKHLASPGLLVGLRFQVEQLLAGRGLDQ